MCCTEFNMKYAALVGDKQFKICDGTFKANGTPIIKVTHIGVCGTDMSYWKFGNHYKEQIIGHEYAGIVVDPGYNPTLRKGDRVVGYTQNIHNEYCGHCNDCLSGDFQKCNNRIVKTWKGGELNHPGAYAEYTTWFSNSIFKLPDSVTNEEGALIEPFAVCLRAVSITDISPNDKILILGGGIIGLGIAEWARSFGAGTVAITEVNSNKIDAIKSLSCADYVIKGDDTEIEQKLLTISNGGFDVVFDCVGFPMAIQTGIKAFKKELRVKKFFTAVALPHRTIELDYDSIVLNEITLKGSKGHTPNEFQSVVKYLEANKIDITKYITKRIPLFEVQKGFEELSIKGTPGKAIIDVT